jgi:hypothetical protein
MEAVQNFEIMSDKTKGPVFWPSEHRSGHLASTLTHTLLGGKLNFTVGL